MGHEIEIIALQRGHEISARFNSSSPLTAEGLAGSDVAIEFSRPELAASHIQTCLEARCPVVVGTTGWYNQMKEVEKTAAETNGSLLYGTNFSLGVNIAFFVNKILAKIMNQYPEYSAMIEEIHHTRKLDAPSGTAITLAEGLLNGNKQYSEWTLAEQETPKPKLAIKALRVGDVPGTHTVEYTSDIDSIELKHTAHNRRGFALGSVLAAEWLKDKKGVYSMEDMLNFDALI